MTGLRIADDLHLPAEAVTETFAILGKRGRGKTSTAVVLAEEMIGAGLPVVVLDPVGVWWGLRADSTGDGPGLPVVIFGGDHADIPLQPGSGALVADVIIDQRPPAVIDLGGLSKGEMRRWSTDFLEQLYRRNRTALHLLIDEADAFAPQRPGPDGARLLGAMEDLVRRGRARGLGCSLITQRPAVLHKDVLTQAEVLVALGMTGPRDVAAIDEWVRLHADDDQAREVKKSLAALPVGNAWWWSPSWLELLQRVQVRPRWTFDSSATPKPGEQRTVPDRMADVDIARISEAMAEVVEQAENDDPARLRARIRELEQQRPAAEPKTVEVPVLTEQQIAGLQVQVEAARTIGMSLVAAADGIQARLAAYRPDAAQAVERPPALRESRNDHQPRPRRTTTPGPAAAGGGPTKLSRAQAAILHVLVQQGRPLTHTQIAILSRYSRTSGGYKNALSALRTSGLIVGGKDRIEITDAGIAAAGDVPPKPTGPALVKHWTDWLPKAEGTLLLCLLQAWPGPMSADELADASGYSRTSGGFKNALSKLRTLELASGGAAAVTACDELGEANRG